MPFCISPFKGTHKEGRDTVFFKSMRKKWSRCSNSLLVSPAGVWCSMPWRVWSPTGL